MVSYNMLDILILDIAMITFRWEVYGDSAKVSFKLEHLDLLDFMGFRSSGL